MGDWLRRLRRCLSPSQTGTGTKKKGASPHVERIRAAPLGSRGKTTMSDGTADMNRRLLGRGQALRRRVPVPTENSEQDE